ncbi:hypothetical protein MU1_04370 [Paenibacillus glycanilyticus]|uniref:Lipoprotein n=2 Tax=Paenibacillus glycanilyticus TaxID=126569 RepID=A0ABQ6GA20_9BACL|nr:hypothetical protein MU1_04370 [Paenibacillus glycanilyticus]
MVGCQSEKTESVPTAKMFRIQVSTPENVQADESFDVHSSVVNNSNSTWEMEHGAGMFTYEVYDQKGQLVQLDDKERFVDAIGYVVTLDPKAAYNYDEGEHVSSSYNELSLKEGSYTVISKAKFNVKKDGKEYDIELKSKPFKINVD